MSLTISVPGVSSEHSLEISNDGDKVLFAIETGIASGDALSVTAAQAHQIAAWIRSNVRVSDETPTQTARERILAAMDLEMRRQVAVHEAEGAFLHYRAEPYDMVGIDGDVDFEALVTVVLEAAARIADDVEAQQDRDNGAANTGGAQAVADTLRGL